jgi:hypothetical protein
MEVIGFWKVDVGLRLLTQHQTQFTQHQEQYNYGTSILRINRIKPNLVR